MSKLIAVQIKKLFGHFDHNLNLEHDERITAIIGPNGYGKTISLRLIHSLLSKRFWQLQKVNFEKIIYTFADKSYINVKRHQEDRNSLFGEILIDAMKGNSSVGQLEIHIHRPNQPPSVLRPTPPSLNQNSMNTVEMYLPFLSRIGPREWYDTVDETKLDVGDLFDKYGDQLPDNVFDTISSESSKCLDELIDGVECRLIETQRLVSSAKRITSPQHSYQQLVRRTTKSSRYAVNQKADRLKEIIKDTTTDYASLSQKLDRSFPRRVIELTNSEVLENLVLQKDLEQLEAKRKALMDLCIIDQEIEPVRLRSGIPDELRRMMTVYNDDMSKKLGKFDKLSRRIDLFKNILDGRLAGKSIVIDRQEGFKVQSKWENLDIPLDKLSSGEQHQLVLIFELLFEISPKSLILIDEPELSLHLTWQKKFIADLVDIIQLNDFDVVLATHSPQLVGKWWHLTEELGDVEE